MFKTVFASMFVVLTLGACIDSVNELPLTAQSADGQDFIKSPPPPDPPDCPDGQAQNPVDGLCYPTGAPCGDPNSASCPLGTHPVDPTCGACPSDTSSLPCGIYECR